MIFIDIDGTLTDAPKKKWGNVHSRRIEAIKRLCASSKVVLWSGGGADYARAFADEYGLINVICIGKPTRIIDDNPSIRPNGLERLVISPDALEKELCK